MLTGIIHKIIGRSDIIKRIIPVLIEENVVIDGQNEHEDRHDIYVEENFKDNSPNSRSFKTKIILW
jgi:hypothetical protein